MTFPRVPRRSARSAGVRKWFACPRAGSAGPCAAGRGSPRRTGARTRSRTARRSGSRARCRSRSGAWRQAIRLGAVSDRRRRRRGACWSCARAGPRRRRSRCRRPGEGWSADVLRAARALGCAARPAWRDGISSARAGRCARRASIRRRCRGSTRSLMSGFRQAGFSRMFLRAAHRSGATLPRRARREDGVDRPSFRFVRGCARVVRVAGSGCWRAPGRRRAATAYKRENDEARRPAPRRASRPPSGAASAANGEPGADAPFGARRRRRPVRIESSGERSARPVRRLVERSRRPKRSEYGRAKGLGASVSGDAASRRRQRSREQRCDGGAPGRGDVAGQVRPASAPRRRDGDLERLLRHGRHCRHSDRTTVGEEGGGPISCASAAVEYFGRAKHAPCASKRLSPTDVPSARACQAATWSAFSSGNAI